MFSILFLPVHPSRVFAVTWNHKLSRILVDLSVTAQRKEQLLHHAAKSAKGGSNFVMLIIYEVQLRTQHFDSNHYSLRKSHKCKCANVFGDSNSRFEIFSYSADAATIYTSKSRELGISFHRCLTTCGILLTPNFAKRPGNISRKLAFFFSLQNCRRMDQPYTGQTMEFHIHMY